MARLNRSDSRPRTGVSPVKTEQRPTGRTHQGGAGYARDVQSELFLLAVSSMFGEDKFYETARTGNDRYVHLVREAAVVDPDWTADFLHWLRSEANMRTAAIVGAAQYAWARRDEAGTGRTGTVHPTPSHTVRQVVASVLQRPDEPGEFVAYWRENIQRSLPGGVQRGVGDAVLRMFHQRSYLKWDSGKRAYRFADVLNITHPGDRKGSSQRFRGDDQRALFAYITAKPYREVEPDELLKMLHTNAWLRQQEELDAWLSTDNLANAGMTWEDALSAVGSKVDKARLWEAVMPVMGYMALLRNLRNFDEAGVSDEMAKATGELLALPAEVKRSRQLPLRFLSAYRAAPSLRWAPYLEKALQLSLENVPQLRGRTLVLVDVSGSMNNTFSKDGELRRWDAAAVFGLALAQRCEFADVVAFDDTTQTFPLRKGESLLRSVDRWKSGGYFRGGGTYTHMAVNKHYRDHNRVVVLTDEQVATHTPYGVFQSVPTSRPTYTWNLAGYRRGHDQSGVPNRHVFGGLTDQAFGLIPLLEAGRDGGWPWENRG